MCGPRNREAKVVGCLQPKPCGLSGTWRYPVSRHWGLPRGAATHRVCGVALGVCGSPGDCARSVTPFYAFPRNPPSPLHFGARRGRGGKASVTYQADKADSVVGSPAIRLCHITLGSFIGHDVAWCMRQRLSQMTASPGFHSW